MTEVVTQTGTGWASGRVLAPGARIADRYRVERFLAAGGMGEVYEVTDELLGERVALKVLTTASDDLEAEVRLARRVTHPNVCRVFDLGLHQGDGRTLRFLTMELVHGEPLSAVLRKHGRLPAARVRKIVAAVCAALEAAHVSGVVHGDLKPANVLLTGAGRVVVTDFGLARSLEVVAPSSHASPGYISPEQVAGLPLTPASDIYALGVMIFELLTGELPFRGDSPGDTARLRLSTPPQTSRLPGEFREVVSACLALDPRNRPAAPSFSGRGRGRGWRVVAIALGLLVLIAGLGLALHGPRAAFVPIGVTVQVDAPHDPWLARAAAAHIARQLERTRWLKVSAEGGVPLLVSISPAGDRLRLGIRVRAEEHTAEAVSVAEGLAALVPAVLASLGANGPAPASQRELDQMKRHGASDVLAFRAYVDADDLWRSVEVDNEALARNLEQVIDRDAGWARLWAKLAVVYGMQGARAEGALKRARAAVAAGRDSAGDTLLDSIALLQGGEPARAAALVASLQPLWADDLVVGWVRSVALYRLGRLDELVALELRLFELRPDLQWGGDLVSGLYYTGREPEIPAFIEAWVATAPDNPQALIAAAHLATSSGDPGAALWLERLDRLHGESIAGLVASASIFIGLDRFADARRAAAALSEHGPNRAAFGQLYFATMSIFEGRLGSARESLVPALEQGRPWGLESMTMQILSSLTRLDRLAGRADEERAHLLDLAQTLREFGDGALADALTVEADLVRAPRDCSGIAPALEAMKVPLELVAKRHLTRVAARYGCADCAAVLREGSGLKEQSNESLLVYGRCAADAGQLPTARRALERATRLTTVTGGRLELESPFDAVLARYYLAGVAARQGATSEAIALYRDFLARWSNTEVVVPELALARAELARLTGGELK